MKRMNGRPRTKPSKYDISVETIGGVLDWYISTGQMAGITKEWEQQCLYKLNKFRQAFADWPLSKIKPFHLQMFVADHTPDQSNWTRRHWYVIIKKPFNLAFRLGLVDVNPFANA